jgi:hypothetical protein
MVKTKLSVLLLLSLTSLLSLESLQVQAKSNVSDSSTQGTPVQASRAMSAAKLPKSVANGVLQDMSRRTGMPTSDLRIVGVEQQLFNGCLSVASPDTPCTAIGISGWRVTVQGRQQRWVYHATQNHGLKLNGLSSIARSLANAALQDASRRSGLPTSQLKIFWVEPKAWPNGCLGIDKPGVGCTLAQVPGWQVTVANGQKRWVYRTGLSGNNVLLDVAASQPQK